MANKSIRLQIIEERVQAHPLRKNLYKKISQELGDIYVMSYFTSFKFPVFIDDSDVSIIEDLLKQGNKKKGIALIISSPGGDGLTAERIINLFRAMKGSTSWKVIVPGKAKSAATMIALGADEILMAPHSELGPDAPQVPQIKGKTVKWFPANQLVETYESLFKEAVSTKGHLEPYLQQLKEFNAADITSYRTAIKLSESITIKALKEGVLREESAAQIKDKMKVFLTPIKSLAHGRPIFHKEAKACGLNITSLDLESKLWEYINELNVRLDTHVSTVTAKCIEDYNISFSAGYDNKRK